MSTRRNRPVEITDAIVKRSIPIGRLELRETDETDNEYILSGYASTFQEYDMYGGPANYGWIERIDPGAFDKTLREKPDLHLLLNHDGAPLARTKSGTLSLSVDNHGLKVEARLDKRDPEAQSLAVKMQRGDLDEMSFAFRVKAQEWRAADGFEDDDQSYRTITEVSLHKGDVSVVNWGANPTTSAGIRSASDAVQFLADCDAEELAEVRANDDATRRAFEKLGTRIGKDYAASVMSVAEVREHESDAVEERDVSVTVNIEVTDDDEAEDSTVSDETLSADSDAEERTKGRILAIRFEDFERPLISYLLRDSRDSEGGYEIVLNRDQVCFQGKLFAEAEAHYRESDPEGMHRLDVIEAEMKRRRDANPDALTFPYLTDEEVDALLAAEARKESKKGMSLRLALALGDE